MKKFPITPDYTHSILNLSNSILADFSVTPFHQTLPEIDAVLLHGAYTHVALIVCDAMGSMNLDELLPKNSFLVQHRIATISSVFPPTTTAATTTLTSGLSPAQHGWLGWQPYIPELNDAVELFPNNIPDRLVVDNSHAHIEHPDEEPPYHVGRQLLSYKMNNDSIKEKGNVDTSLYAPFLPIKDSHRVNTISEIAEAVLIEGAKEKRTYTYCYWPQPDTAMHHTGITSAETHAEVAAINNTLQTLEQKLRILEKSHPEFGKTIVIVTADHGHMDSVNIDINEYEDILDSLTSVPSLEPRATTFFVRKEKRSNFPKLFYSHFSENDFILLTKEELLSSGLFGPVTESCKQHELVEKMAGDFITIAIGDKSIFNSKENAEAHKGMHAGLSAKELYVPLIVF